MLLSIRHSCLRINDYKAFDWYEKAANQGYANAQNSLGVCYGNGKGITQDYKKAVAWYQKASNQGLANAQYNLGVCHENGKGVPPDKHEAIRLYRLAAAQGNGDAQKPSLVLAKNSPLLFFSQQGQALFKRYLTLSIQ